jgi:hypothetical protein
MLSAKHLVQGVPGASGGEYFDSQLMWSGTVVLGGSRVVKLTPPPVGL